MKGERMDSTKIAKTLRALRGNQTIKTVADSVGISVSALSMYENGDRIPRDEIKVKIARFYGKTIEEIFFS
jgi:transcriptional regulator with XRE-family HTH domain